MPLFQGDGAAHPRVPQYLRPLPGRFPQAVVVGAGGSTDVPLVVVINTPRLLIIRASRGAAPRNVDHGRVAAGARNLLAEQPPHRQRDEEHDRQREVQEIQTEERRRSPDADPRSPWTGLSRAHCHLRRSSKRASVTDSRRPPEALRPASCRHHRRPASAPHPRHQSSRDRPMGQLDGRQLGDLPVELDLPPLVHAAAAPLPRRRGPGRRRRRCSPTRTGPWRTPHDQ